MVFWDIYPFTNLIKSVFNKNTFKSLQFTRNRVESPTGIKAKIITKTQNLKYISEIQLFLKTTFGSPPKTPVLDIPYDFLLGEKDHIVFVKDIDKQIVGCIRYHYLGQFISSKNEEIYCVDCYCVHPKWRKRGIGDYLLTILHNYVNEQNIPYSMFLKEGKILSIIHKPFYSGTYVFRELNQPISQKYIKYLTNEQAYKILDIFKELNSKIFIIYNLNTPNQFWRLYKKDNYTVLVCFQDTFQRFEENNKTKKICWITAWIESPNMTDKVREEASKSLSVTMYKLFDYVWMNKEWCGSNSENIWKIDGNFHWYLYQWTTSLNIKESYCILN